MENSKLTTADILRENWDEFFDEYGSLLSPEQIKAAHDIMACRTIEMGGHCEHRRCDHCGHETKGYNSCGNRACPKCGPLASAKWLASRRAELLPVQYFHIVFTMPKEIEELALINRRVVYDILFKTSAQTMLTIAKDPKHLGADIGFTSVLHTWGSTLPHHPHVHMIVPGGGISPDGKRWVTCREDFFLHVNVLKSLFRRLFLEALKRAYEAGKLRFTGKSGAFAQPKAFAKFLKKHRGMKWHIYAKAPFGGPETTLNYLARYTHRSAISDHRLITMSKGKVSFRYKDYKKEGEKRVMTLSATEFIRRFLMHVPPKGFTRIRHYGLLANRFRARNIKRCRDLLGAPEPEPIERYDEMDWAERYLALTGHDPLLCPVCKKGRLELVTDEHDPPNGVLNITAEPPCTEGGRRAVGPPETARESPPA